MKLYNFYHFHGFGDCWRSACMALLESEQQNDKVGLCTVTSEGDRLLLLQEIINELDSKGRVILLQDSKFLGEHLQVNQNVPVIPTKIRWNKGVYNRIAYQFDGKYNGRYKNPPKEHIDLFFRYAKDNGIEVVNIGESGGRLNIRQYIEIVSKCDLFVGVCSGMAQLCYSVGIPVVILRYNQFQDAMDLWHGNNPYGIFKNIPDLLDSDLAKDGFRVRDGIIKPLYSVSTFIPERSNDKLIRKIIEMPTLNRYQLNGCIHSSPYKDSYYLAYRQINGTNHYDSHLRIGLIDQFYRYKDEPKKLNVSGYPEDPRIFKWDDRYFITYTKREKHPFNDYYAALYLSELRPHYWFTNVIPGTECRLRNPDCPYMSQKNWLPFIYQDKLHFVYSVQPHVIYEWDIEKGIPVNIYHSIFNFDFWSQYGQIRGSTAPIKIENEWICFFHSSVTDNNWKRTYYIGVYSFEDKIPFKIKRISQKPIECDDFFKTPNLTVFYKHDVVFPMGVILEKDKLIVSYGHQDTTVNIMEININELMNILV